MRRTTLWLFVGLLGGAAHVHSADMAKIAVGDFVYKGKAELQDGTAPLSDMISTALVKTRRFQVVERPRVQEAIKEMALGEAGLVDAESAQKFGTLVGADFVLFGTITQASLDAKAVQVSGMTSDMLTMRLSVDIRVIDAKTGEIKTAENIERKKTAAKSVTVNGKVASAEGASGIVGDVLREVADETIRVLIEGIYPITIASIKDGEIMLNYGGSVIKDGTVYDVFSQGEAVLDPATGNVLGREESTVGQIRITSTHAKFSKAVVVSGEDKIQEGMICRQSEAKPAEAKKAAVPW